MDALAIHPTSECRKSCPFCYAKQTQGSIRPWDFFQNILKESQEIPLWIYACNWVQPNTWVQMAELIQMAWKCKHAYAITTNYENITQANMPLFQAAQSVTVSLDEHKVHEHRLPEFLRTLDKVQKTGTGVKVSLTLTARMLYRLMHGNLLGRLLPQVKHLYLVLPKTPGQVWTPPSLLQVFQAWFREKVTRLEVFEKVELDHCLWPILSPWQELVSKRCAYHQVLSVMPDGCLKICPYGSEGLKLQKPKEIRAVLAQPDLLHCQSTAACFLKTNQALREDVVCHAT